jgi:phospholipid/cholesterol/gamma-HCH transport system permease protein
VASGVSKTVFFGFAIGVIACYEGLNTTAGTVGVGLSTTRAVVMSSIAVLVLNFFLTKLFILL